MLEQILARKNMIDAFKRVKANRGAPGIDGITLEDFARYLKDNWVTVKQEILEGKYKPQPVRRVEIPKPDGGIRKLGIPTVLDRLIQQAILQVLTPVFEEKFSESSYGFRPKRSAHNALRKAQQYIENGHKYVVDIDMEKFFDTVNQDRLMARLAKTIDDKRVLRLIRRYLQSGVMENGVKAKTDIGTPQGGPLSPLLANVVLDELDKELERRGHKFCRYADDCNIYVKSKRAGERVMRSITNYVEGKLKLKVNQKKSAVDTPNKRKFLGCSVYWNKEGKVRITIAKKSKKRLRKKIKELTQRSQSMSMENRVDKINRYLIGWLGYFSIADMKSFLAREDQRLRRRLRMCKWKQWKKVKTRYKNLRKLGKSHQDAIKYANTRKGYWRVSNSVILSTTLTNKFFKELGLISLVDQYLSFVSPNKPPYTRPVRTVV